MKAAKKNNDIYFCNSSLFAIDKLTELEYKCSPGDDICVVGDTDTEVFFTSKWVFNRDNSLIILSVNKKVFFDSILPN